MSERKKADIVGSTSKGVTTTEKKVRIHPIHRKLWLIAVVGLLFVVAICAAVYLFAIKPDNNKPTSSNKPASLSTDSNTTETQESPYDRAYDESLQGNTGPMKSLLDQQLKTATTATQKVQVYDQQIVLALNSQQYDEAISIGQQAYAVSPTSQTADLVANAYEAKGDKADAKTWVQDAINDLDKNSPTYNTDMGQYKSELAGLGS